MPKRKVHLATSGALGGLYALYKCGDQPDSTRFCELVGGIAGGCLGGRAPDVLDPPNLGPRHRGRAHSLAAGITVLNLNETQLRKWQDTCRGWAEDFAQKRGACSPDSQMRFVYTVADIGCRMLAGLIAGFLAGYVTHLALDAFTPSSLNVI